MSSRCSFIFVPELMAENSVRECLQRVRGAVPASPPQRKHGVCDFRGGVRSPEYFSFYVCQPPCSIPDWERWTGRFAFF